MGGDEWVMLASPLYQCSSMSSGLYHGQLWIMLVLGVQKPGIFTTEMSQDKVNVCSKDLGF